MKCGKLGRYLTGVVCFVDFQKFKKVQKDPNLRFVFTKKQVPFGDLSRLPMFWLLKIERPSTGPTSSPKKGQKEGVHRKHEGVLYTARTFHRRCVDFSAHLSFQRWVRNQRRCSWRGQELSSMWPAHLNLRTMQPITTIWSWTCCCTFLQPLLWFSSDNEQYEVYLPTRLQNLMNEAQATESQLSEHKEQAMSRLMQVSKALKTQWTTAGRIFW